MTAAIIDGKHVASLIKETIKQSITSSCKNGLRAPGLAVILIGNDPASELYVNAKRKACLDVGIKSFSYNLSTNTTENELLSLIDTLNKDININGILVQLPLPNHINTDAVIERINPQKDVDGFHPYNFGRLAQGNPTLRPCTPYGVMQLLDYYKLDPSGKECVIIGASNIVGRPMALEMMYKKATVTVCHHLTKDLELHVQKADIIISATGVRNLVKTEWLHKNQIIIDIGIHRLPDQTLCGDIDFHQAIHKVAWITPVPGGVGPMTISTLLQNTLYCAREQTEVF